MLRISGMGSGNWRKAFAFMRRAFESRRKPFASLRKAFYFLRKAFRTLREAFYFSRKAFRTLREAFAFLRSQNANSRRAFYFLRRSLNIKPLIWFHSVLPLLKTYSTYALNNVPVVNTESAFI